MSTKISIVLSFYNEEEVLDELLRRIKSVFSLLGDKYICELIFVNDNSTDNSLGILTRHARMDNGIKILNMSRNFGVSECTLAGMKFSSGQAVIIMDTDLQDPPEVIPLLIKKWEDECADVVNTIRTSRKGEHFSKLLATRLGYKILRFISSIDLPIESGDFKLISRKAVNHIVRLEEKEPFLRGLVRWVGFKQVFIEYKRESRYAGNTHYKFYGAKVLKNFLSGVTSFSDAPLYLIFILGLIVFCGAFIFLLAVFVMKFLSWNLPGWSAIMVLLLTFGGIQILSLGIIGIYIAKIHIEVKKRPNFIINNTIGFEENNEERII